MTYPNDFGPERRPYAHIAADQQPGIVVDEGPGWTAAVLVAVIPAALIGVYVSSLRGEVTVPGRVIDTTVATGPTTEDIIASAVGSFVGLVLVLRALFALLNIERALTHR